MRSKKPVRKEKGAGQKGKCYPVKNKLHFRVSQGETEKLVKVSKSVEPAGKFLLAYQKRREGKLVSPLHSIKSGISPAPRRSSFKCIASAYSPSPKKTPWPRLKIPPLPQASTSPSDRILKAKKRPSSESS